MKRQHLQWSWLNIKKKKGPTPPNVTEHAEYILYYSRLFLIAHSKGLLMGQFSDMALLRVLQLWTQSESLRCSIRRLLPYFTCENTRHSLGFTLKHCSVWLFSFDTFSPDTDPLLVNKRHFQGNVSKPQSQNKHVGYTADINLMSLLSVQAIGYTLKREGYQNP